MASVASWRDDNNGTLVTAGTSVALTVATNQVESALTAGYTIALQLNQTVDAGATLAPDGLTPKPIQIVAGTPISYNLLQAGAIQRVTYSTTGTGQWIVQGGVAPAASSTSTSPLLSSITNSLSGNVSLTTTSYFDGPSVSQGSSGTWLASGTVTFVDSGAASTFNAKLWDGTTVIASASAATGGAAFKGVISLSGTLASPAGNIRISLNENNSGTGSMLFNFSGNSKDCTVTALRIG